MASSYGFNVCFIGLILCCNIFKAEGLLYGNKCSFTKEIEQFIAECDKDSKPETQSGTEDKPVSAKFFRCLLNKMDWIDENYVANKDGVLASISKYYIASDTVMEQLKLGFTACFIDYTGTPEQGNIIGKCLNMMQTWACDAVPECENEETWITTPTPNI